LTKLFGYEQLRFRR